MGKEDKRMKLTPNEHGNYPCPHCTHILTPIFRVWLLIITDYICHYCQIGFKINPYNGKQSGGIV